MLELSRRFFLFGSAAALASTALTLPNVDPSLITLATSSHTAKIRKAYRLLFAANSEADGALMLEVTRVGRGSTGLLILSYAISPRANFMWRAMDGEEIYLPEGHALGVSVTPDPGLNARMEVVYRDEKDEVIAELFEWRDGRAFVTDTVRMNA